MQMPAARVGPECRSNYIIPQGPLKSRRGLGWWLQVGGELQEAEASLQQTIGLRLTELLMAIVGHVLGRSYHRRRARVSRRLRQEGKCCRCGSNASHRFSRNGLRIRHLLTRWGLLTIHLPRVRCVCGGSVRIDFDGLLRSYQRIWDDVDVQIRRWGALALSLRQMRVELAHWHIRAPGLAHPEPAPASNARSHT
jgi:hypothetical protein